MMDSVKFEKGTVKMIAHRGLSGIECENTCAAFVAAGNRSYFGIETDLHVTSDGKFVIIHDDFTDRVGDVNLSVEQSTLAQLKQVNLRDVDKTYRTDLKIPSLSDYISICKKYGKTCVLELKNPFSRNDLQRLIKEIKGLGYLDGVIFISFHFDNLVTVREFLPDHPVQFLIDKCNRELMNKLISLKIDLDIHHLGINTELVNAFHKAGLKVNCWTVDNPKDAKKYADMGVDFITSNILE